MCFILNIVNFVVEKAKVLEEKFNKLKDVYGKLREEHIQLIRQVSFSNKTYFKVCNENDE